MSLKAWSFAIPLVSFTLVASTSMAQTPAVDPKSPPVVEEKAVGERVGETVDGAVQSLKRGVTNAGDMLREQWDKARNSVHGMGVAARVYGRLHWDKGLAESKVDVDVQKGGVAILTGSVNDSIARAKAIQLTKDTVGVTNVVDRLTIMTTTSGTTVVPVKPVKP